MNKTEHGKDECIYMLYRVAKKLLKREEERCDTNYSDFLMFQEFRHAIKIFDRLVCGYAERYENEIKNGVNKK